MSKNVAALDPASFDPVQTGFFRFRRLDGRYLITNDFGRYRFLSDEDFRSFVAGTVDKASLLYERLAKDGFIRDHMDFEALAGVWRNRNRFLWEGARLHRIAVSLRGLPGVSKGDSAREMSLATAAKIVDRIFSSPSPSLAIEFQGPEPLANWPAVEFIVAQSRRRALDSAKGLRLSLASNLSLMTDEKLRFLIENEVGVLAALDGPAGLHEKNRSHVGGGPHAGAARWFRALQAKTKGASFRAEGAAAVTRASLSRAEEIVDEYVRLGAGGLTFRRLDPVDVGRGSWSRIGCSADEFLEFYRGALDYILALNGRKTFSEGTARTFLARILTDADPEAMNVRSPAGGGLGELAYDVDGSVYTCAEGLALSRAGDDSFRIGSALRGSYQDAAAHPAVKAVAIASCLDNQPDCSRCAYKPYHGVSPVQCYAEQGDIMGRMPTNSRCRVHKGILDYLFEKLRDEKNETIFRKWLRQKEEGVFYQRL